MPSVSVIVPARDAAATLPRTLAALARQEPVPGGHEVIVVDDGSRDSTFELARAAPEDAVRVLAQGRRGPAHARNAGAAAARGPLLAFCDADVYPEPGWLRAGVEALREMDLAQGRVLPDPDAWLGPFDRTIWVTRPIGLFEGAAMFVRRDVFQTVGGFEEWLRPRRGKALAEDVWFGWRVRRVGARCGFAPEALAYHAVFPRGWAGYVAERARVRYFPAMVAQVPELREAFLHRRVFLDPRTMRLDAALAGVAGATIMRRPAPLLAALPYVRAMRRPPRVAAADLVADLVGAGALLAGSVRYRALVL